MLPVFLEMVLLYELSLPPQTTVTTSVKMLLIKVLKKHKQLLNYIKNAAIVLGVCTLSKQRLI